MRIRAEAFDFRRTIGLCIFDQNPDGTYRFVTELEYDSTRPEGLDWPTTASISLDAAQTLIDDLWRCGIRPSEGSGSAGSLAATERHLEDMRQIVFEAGLRVEKPNSR